MLKIAKIEFFFQLKSRFNLDVNKASSDALKIKLIKSQN